MQNILIKPMILITLFLALLQFNTHSFADSLKPIKPLKSLQEQLPVNRTLNDLTVLLGHWKAENQNIYEFWSVNNKQSLKGFVYKLDKDDKQHITETLGLKQINSQWVYQATVMTQNEGKTINFVLNHKIKNLFSFENEKHDFPKKIQYKKITSDKLLVTVKGANDKGFSYHLLRQK